MAKTKIPFYHRPIGDLGLDMLSRTAQGLGWTLRKGYNAGSYVLGTGYNVGAGVATRVKNSGVSAANVAKIGLLTAVGVGAAFYFNKDELTKPSPYDITGVAEKKIDEKNFATLKLRNGSLTDMVEREQGVLRNLDDVQEEKLKEVDEANKTEKQAVNDKYKAMEEKANALK